MTTEQMFWLTELRPRHVGRGFYFQTNCWRLLDFYRDVLCEAGERSKLSKSQHGD